VLKLVFGMLQLLGGHAVHVIDPSSDQNPATSARHTVALVCARSLSHSVHQHDNFVWTGYVI
jgi:hypothetical protein